MKDIKLKKCKGDAVFWVEPFRHKNMIFINTLPKEIWPFWKRRAIPMSTFCITHEVIHLILARWNMGEENKKFDNVKFTNVFTTILMCSLGYWYEKSLRMVSM